MTCQNKTAYFIVVTINGSKECILTINVLERNKIIFDSINSGEPQVNIFMQQYETTLDEFNKDLHKLITNSDFREITINTGFKK